jgi:hypothetical protein
MERTGEHILSEIKLSIEKQIAHVLFHMWVFKVFFDWSSVVAHTGNPSTWEAEAGGAFTHPEVQE